jgi:hypothetical protein
MPGATIPVNPEASAPEELVGITDLEFVKMSDG